MSSSTQRNPQTQRADHTQNQTRNGAARTQIEIWRLFGHPVFHDDLHLVFGADVTSHNEAFPPPPLIVAPANQTLIFFDRLFTADDLGGR
ncbi:MAG: hypothetical protein HOQ05_08525 [Corynebacteriales bacterium]|nr:hypothetical protein [Mycobacteriales bacterium]